jgi:glycosyltransferase involved in cell wall biosynthesis
LNEFSGFALIDEDAADPPMDALITTWGISDRGVTPTIAVAHSAFQKYRELMQTVRFDHAVAVAEAARGCFLDRSAVDIIYNGVDIARLKPVEPRGAVRARLGLAPDGVVIGYVGRWGYQKNPLAAAIAAAQIPGASVLYIGPRPENGSMVREVLSLAPCCFVTPEEVGHIGDLFAAMDVCMFASRTEGFGLALAEAWYARVPVVATPVGIAAEHPDLVYGLPPEPTPLALKLAVERALKGRGVDLNKARRTVVDRYSADRMVKDWRAYILARLDREPPLSAN